MGIRHEVKISSFLKEERTFDGSKIRTYDKPKEYTMSLNAISGYSELQMFGDVANRIVKGVIDIKLSKRIKELDVAYLYGATNENEKAHGENANYEVKKVLPQNIKAIVYFEKINKDEDQH